MNFRIVPKEGQPIDIIDADKEQVTDGILIVGRVRVPLVNVAYWLVLSDVDPVAEELVLAD